MRVYNIGVFVSQPYHKTMRHLLAVEALMVT